MSVLFGIDLSGERAELTVVDRRGEVQAVFEEPLEAPMSKWWTCHPDETVRRVEHLLARPMREGVVRGGQVAGIGLTASPAVVLLDAELDVVPPRDVGWQDLLDAESDESSDARLRQALFDIAERDARVFKRCGALFSLLDYVRFRLTGAIATHESFATLVGLASGTSAATESPLDIGHWDAAVAAALGLRAAALPPIFAATLRVGVVGPEAIAATGLGPGVWVGGGSDPVSAQLVIAAEPVLETWHLRIDGPPGDDGAIAAYRVGGPPSSFVEPGVLPSAVDGIWFHPEANPIAASGMASDSDRDPRRCAWSAPGGMQLTLDSRLPQLASDWTQAPGGDVWFAWDCGRPSAAAAIPVGIALGWWRDFKPLWRKHRSPLAYSDWFNAIDVPGIGKSP